MPTKDSKDRAETPTKKSGEKDDTRPTKEPIAPKKKGELPPDLAEPVVGEAGAPESE